MRSTHVAKSRSAHSRRRTGRVFFSFISVHQSHVTVLSRPPCPPHPTPTSPFPDPPLLNSPFLPAPRPALFRPTPFLVSQDGMLPLSHRIAGRSLRSILAMIPRPSLPSHFFPWSPPPFPPRSAPHLVTPFPSPGSPRFLFWLWLDRDAMVATSGLSALPSAFPLAASSHRTSLPFCAPSIVY
jgi:hypothetical protein